MFGIQQSGINILYKYEGLFLEVLYSSSNFAKQKPTNTAFYTIYTRVHLDGEEILFLSYF